jgi:hypothetical protein
MPKKRPNRRIDPTGRSKRGERFIKLPHWLLNNPAYQSLSLGARSLLIEVWRRHNGINNGEISYSVREAAKSLRCSKNTAANWFQELQKKGFLKPRQPGSFSYKKRHATEWEITAEPYRGKPASKDFMRWKPADEIQNTVPVRGTDGPTQRDRAMHDGAKNTHHGPNQKDRHPPNGPPHGPTERDTSNIPGGCKRSVPSEKRNDALVADLLVIPECFDRRKKKIGPQAPLAATDPVSAE